MDGASNACGFSEVGLTLWLKKWPFVLGSGHWHCEAHKRASAWKMSKTLRHLSSFSLLVFVDAMLLRVGTIGTSSGQREALANFRRNTTDMSEDAEFKHVSFVCLLTKNAWGNITTRCSPIVEVKLDT